MHKEKLPNGAYEQGMSTGIAKASDEEFTQAEIDSFTGEWTPKYPVFRLQSESILRERLRLLVRTLRGSANQY